MNKKSRVYERKKAGQEILFLIKDERDFTVRKYYSPYYAVDASIKHDKILSAEIKVIFFLIQIKDSLEVQFIYYRQM